MMYPERAPTYAEFRFANSWFWFGLRHLPRFLVTSELLREMEPESIAWWYRPAHYDCDRDCTLFAILPLVPIVKVWSFWQRHRWDHIKLGLRLRLCRLEEGGYYKDARWFPRDVENPVDNSPRG